MIGDAWPAGSQNHAYWCPHKFMGLLPSLKSHEVIAALVKAGFRIIRQSGSHVRLQHSADATRQTTVPQHSAPLPLWLMRAILRQAKISVTEFRKLIRRK